MDETFGKWLEPALAPGEPVVGIFLMNKVTRPSFDGLVITPSRALLVAWQLDIDRRRITSATVAKRRLNWYLTLAVKHRETIVGQVLFQAGG